MPNVAKFHQLNLNAFFWQPFEEELRIGRGPAYLGRVEWCRDDEFHKYILTLFLRMLLEPCDNSRNFNFFSSDRKDEFLNFFVRCRKIVAVLIKEPRARGNAGTFVAINKNVIVH